ncbi:MAG: hypothetical protein LPK09_15415 [Hymenobacteraceae bacterium]|nr:hypothetical protein [Hymenobacteraceae bacterium]
MGLRMLYLLPLLALLVACTQSDAQQEIKKLYPQKVVIGSTTHDFYYEQGRIYSVTTTRPNFYEEVTYRYFDEYFKEPDHRFKNEIAEVHYEPDVGPTGLDRNDSVVRKQEAIWTRTEDGLIPKERHTVYMKGRNIADHILHQYNPAKQLTASIYHYNSSSKDLTPIYDADSRYVYKKITYTYDKQGKLQKAAFMPPGTTKPYLTIELEYDDKPGYLQSLPLEARFMPLELPYRSHNITRYTVRDKEGKVRKDLSYTCGYTYNKDGYPTKVRRNMLDGQELEGYIVYRASIGKPKEIADASLSVEK